MASDLMANVGDISMPDMPDPDIDLSPVGDAMGWMGEMGGDAVSRCVWTLSLSLFLSPSFSLSLSIYRYIDMEG